MNALVFTLMALVLGAIGITVGVDQYQKAERSTNIQQVVSEVASIIGDTKATYGQYGYKGLTAAAALTSGVIPANRLNSTTTPGTDGAPSTTATAAASKFGGAITLRQHATIANAAELTYEAVPADLCVAIVTATEGLARRVDVATGTPKAWDSELSLATLTTNCTTTASVTVKWVIGRV